MNSIVSVNTISNIAVNVTPIKKNIDQPMEEV